MKRCGSKVSFNSLDDIFSYRDNDNDDNDDDLEDFVTCCDDMSTSVASIGSNHRDVVSVAGSVALSDGATVTIDSTPSLVMSSTRRSKRCRIKDKNRGVFWRRRSSTNNREKAVASPDKLNGNGVCISSTRTASMFATSDVGAIQTPCRLNPNLSPFENLLDDVKVHITSFLSISETVCLMMTSRQHMRLISQRTELWYKLCRQVSPHLSVDMPLVFHHNDMNDNNDSMRTTDPHLSVADTPTVPPQHLMALMCRAPLPQTMRINSRRCNPHQRDYDPGLVRPRLMDCFNLVTIPWEGRPVLQYRGTVGVGDRSLQADEPLPLPDNYERFLSRKKKFLQYFQPPPVPRPFMSPFVHGGKVRLAPRYTSYFEVSIWPASPEFLTANPNPNNSIKECVAVGISDELFVCTKRMPGWDKRSFAYHGDDGGIFHGSGEMIKRYGPSFGNGDTVGCGVDYRCGGIFFTLNGRFLGYAWTNLKFVMQHRLYPTMGFDTNQPVDWNFGDREFMFDLLPMLRDDGAAAIAEERRPGVWKECCNAS